MKFDGFAGSDIRCAITGSDSYAARERSHGFIDCVDNFLLLDHWNICNSEIVESKFI